MGTWIDACSKEPCIICGKGDWCSRSTDGAWAICRRLQRDDAIVKHDRNGSEFFLYRLGDQTPRKPAVSLPDVPTARLADVSTRDRIYRALLSDLGLSAEHRADLEKRGLSGAHILAGDYASLPLQGRAKIAQRLVDAYGQYDRAGVPGLYVASEGARRWWTLAGMPGLLIPVRDADGRIVALKIRADHGDPRYSTFSSRKHGGPGPGALCHVPLHTGLATDVVRVTEGELKADVATALSEVLTLSVPGVGNWRLALPVLEALGTREVLVAFDADWRSNGHVARALSAAASELRRLRYIVWCEIWARASGKGIDDVLHKGVTPGREPGVRAETMAWYRQQCTRNYTDVQRWMSRTSH
jgi:hypothetical protein